MNQIHDERENSQTRLLAVEGIYNVRDLGGYAVPGGKQVIWGILYRSGDLHTISDAGRAVLEERKLKTIVDFRGQEEIDKAPDVVLSTVLHNHKLSIAPDSMLNLFQSTADATADASAEEFMREIYRILVNDARLQYREFFRLLSNPENTPLLFHCSAGKDRTGLAAALFFSALGVDRETIYDDYMLSEEYVKEKFALEFQVTHRSHPVWTIRRDYLETAFEQIDVRYGGTDRYLREELDVEPERLRLLYTEKAPAKIGAGS
jgi:protein-tyrosine phosphatase